MSVIGAMYTAISGLNAQAAAFSNIADNTANSQTVGFKRTDTAFQDILTESSPSKNEPGSVIAIPEYQNTLQGTISQTDNPLNLAVSGAGFFAVSETNGITSTNQPTFSAQQYYTRAGDFKMDDNGYLVNSANEYLNGWLADPTTGVVAQNALVPLQVNQSSYAPIATTSIQLAASLPASAPQPASGQPATVTTQLQVYDSLGTAHTVNLNWSQVLTNTTGTGVPIQGEWTVDVNSPDDSVYGTNGTTATTGDLGTADVTFGGSTANAVDLTASPGTPSGIVADAVDPGTVVAPALDPTTGTPIANTAVFSFLADFGGVKQTVVVNLGTYGSPNGTTQYAGTAYSLRGLTQNGVPPGSFSSVTANTNGDIVVNYNNGQIRTIGQVPLITFNAPDALQRQNGQAFTETETSGSALANQAGSGGAGTLVTQSQEASNVDLASELSQLIVAQQAYSANAKVVTTADTLLTTTLNMKQP